MVQRIVIVVCLLITTSLFAQDAAKKSSWYDKVKISGYLQVRNNDILKTNPDMESPQGDKTYGGYDGFSLRRMRFKTSGNIHERVYFYFQADFASEGKNLGALKDAYFDYSLNESGTWKVRGGSSKVPFGFENLQSSQNRISLDRNDPLNSPVKDERDMGLGIHWATVQGRKHFKDLKKLGLKGSGDYGMFYTMFYNGQRANYYAPDEKKFPHTAIRYTHPIQFESGQYMEAGIGGYFGKTVTTKVEDGVYVRNTNGVITADNALGALWDDQRVAAHFVYYPQPFGVQAEFNYGVGPEYKYDAATDKHSIGREPLVGGYIQLMYRHQGEKQEIIPFIKAQYYDGGKKWDNDARSYDIKELEVGFEWHPISAFEVTAYWAQADRRYEYSLDPINRQKGGLLRLQLQVNY